MKGQGLGTAYIMIVNCKCERQEIIKHDESKLWDLKEQTSETCEKCGEKYRVLIRALNPVK